MPNSTTPLWIAARTLLVERGDDFQRQLVNVLRTFDPEAIHDLRVSSRRMREGLALFAPCYPPGALAGLGKSIRSVTRLLGEIRNRDETILFFKSLRDKLGEPCRSEINRLLTDFCSGRKNEVRGLKKGLKRISTSELYSRFRRLVSFPCLLSHPDATADPFAPLAGFACDTLSSRLAIVLQLVPAAREEKNSAAQHQLRIAVKHFRYRLEIMSFLLGDRYREIYPLIKEYQELLGSMHDLDVFSAICREASFSPQVSVCIAEAIAVERGKRFAQFSMLLTNRPFSLIDTVIKDTL